MAVSELSAVEPALDAVVGGEDAGSIDVPSLVTSLGRATLGSRRLARAGLGLSVEAARVAVGGSRVEPARRDFRFDDPTWTENPGYRRVKQLYLAWSKVVEDLVDGADVEWRTRERARFAAGILTSALAPTNTLAGNPAALKRALETGGGSLLTGAKQWLGDVIHNGGMPSQVDASVFTVGQNIAVTPGAVVYRSEVMEVLQYAPTTTEVRARPLVIIPPQINKYYFVDLAPGRSLVEHAVGRGLTVFIISWRNPSKEHGDWDLDTYARAYLDAVEVAREITGSDDVVTLGLCAGGITMSTALSYLAVRGEPKVAAASFAVTLLDWAVPAPIGAFQSSALLWVARRKSRRAGVLDARSLGSVFTWMRPNDLVWNYWVNNYLMGKKPAAFDILAWNGDQTNLPGGLHSQFLDIFEDNLLVAPGGLRVLGEPVDLAAVKIDTYVIGGLLRSPDPVAGVLPGHAALRRRVDLRAVADGPHPDAGLASLIQGPLLHRPRTGSGPGRLARSRAATGRDLVGPLGRLDDRPGR